jgi:hypothetical protein
MQAKQAADTQLLSPHTQRKARIVGVVKGVSVDEIELRAGLNLLSALSDVEEEKLEQQVPVIQW